MKKLTVIKPGLAVLFLGLFLAFSLSGFSQEQIEIEIQVSPHVLNLSHSGEVVTVHTNIAYSSVVGSSVTLNGQEIDWWKSDQQGDFVAKFEMSAIVELDLEVGEYHTLTLSGVKTNGDTFSGSEDILVIDVSGPGRN